MSCCPRTGRRAAAALFLLAHASPAQNGAFSPPVDHDVKVSSAPCFQGIPWFDPIHAAVIPVGPYRGKVLVWDYSELPVGRPPTSWVQRWGIVDPEPPGGGPLVVLRNECLTLTAGASPYADFGSLMCAGHAWTRDGMLLVVGGMRLRQNSPVIADGIRVALLFDAQTASWRRMPDMARRRWYPTVTALGDERGRLFVAGGVNLHDDRFECGADYRRDDAYNTYEVFDPQTLAWHQVDGTRVWNGPRAGPPPKFECAIENHPLDFYPRLFALSERATPVTPGSGRLFMAGMWTSSASLDAVRTPGSWDGPIPQQRIGDGWREYGTAVLLPGFTDVVLTLGGDFLPFRSGVRGVTARVEAIDCAAPAPYWVEGPSMSIRRACCNAVLLPDGAVLVLGGRTTGLGVPEVPVQYPEYLKEFRWHVVQAREDSPRTYHSWALLLPSGRVLSGGGDTRKYDYQLFTPHYRMPGRIEPVWATPLPPDRLEYGRWYTAAHAALPAGRWIEKVVLVAPASVSHNFDMHQRHVELPTAVSDPAVSSVAFRMPLGPSYAPKGWYMAFLVSNQGEPSRAHWVRLD